MSCTVQPVWNNLSKCERTALRDLQNDTSIIIKGRDSGNSVCIMEKDIPGTQMSLSSIYMQGLDTSVCLDVMRMDKEYYASQNF